ncbi:MAG TPA: dethiobiotin synthase [Rhodospirillaceae bacterium]|nr:dethiobiotin synthase [Rhodospirillaceae bacterium]
MTGVFVTGTGTGIGKTLVAAWLVRSWAADYWKPVQSGTDEGWDSDVIRQQVPAARIFPPTHALKAPLSPDQAASREGRIIALEDFIRPQTTAPLVVEGAGGVLVPLNDRHLMADLIKQIGLPAVIVAPSGLGTINHSLLTVEALRTRSIAIAGIILNGPDAPENRRAIEHFSGVSVVAQMPPLPDLTLFDSLPALPWQPWKNRT